MSLTKTFPWFSVFRINLNFVTSMHKRFSIICPLLRFAHPSLDALLSFYFYYHTLCSPPWSRLSWPWSSLSTGFGLGSTSSRMFFLAPHFFCVGAPFQCRPLSFSYYVTNVLFLSIFAIPTSPIRGEIVILSIFVSSSFGSTMSCT